MTAERSATARDPGLAAPLDRKSPLPLWAQLRADLLRRLGAGTFAAAFPGEMTLVAEYRVSRHTVRTALRELRSDGVVLAERGRRPRLADSAEITQPLGTVYSLFASVESAGLRQASLIRHQDLLADGVIADRLGLEASTPLFRLERLRLAGDEPLAVDTAWLPGDLGAGLLDVDFTHTSLYGELTARAGVRLDGGREHIRGVVPTAAEQRLLGIPATTGALLISRTAYAGGRAVEWRRTLIRGDRFALLAEFSSRTGYRLAPDSQYPVTGTMTGPDAPGRAASRPAAHSKHDGSMPQIRQGLRAGRPTTTMCGDAAVLVEAEVGEHASARPTGPPKRRAARIETVDRADTAGAAGFSRSPGRRVSITRIRHWPRSERDDLRPATRRRLCSRRMSKPTGGCGVRRP